MNTFDTAIIKFLENRDPIFLDSFIYSPTQLIECKLISEDDILKEEAIYILDSLNSFNNGIFNSDNEYNLETINEDSPLYSWKYGILAINEFYNERYFKATEYLNEIRDNSPLRKLSKYLYYKSESALFTQDSNLNSSVDALKDVINNKMEDLYFSSVKILFKDLNVKSIKDKHDIALTVIEESLDFISIDIIYETFAVILTKREASRLMALGTILRNPANGLKYFLEYFIYEDFTDSNDLKLIALTSIISEITNQLIKDNFKFITTLEKNNFKRVSNKFLDKLDAFSREKIQRNQDPLKTIKKALILRKKSEKLFLDTNIKQGELFK
ncbi:MAG: hypothetical protein JXR64_11310 [Spirochaetales bacterium]|nr:hypothetical protein [Spirochaetales bacterium]